MWPGTSEVKKAIYSIEEHIDFTVYGSDKNHAWLYDLCCCKKDKDELLLDMPLIMECEWNTSYDDILTDFQKLIVSRAEHRIFICSQQIIEDWTDCVILLMEQIRRYQGTRNGDRYLFGCWMEEGWHFRQYVHPSPIPTIRNVWLFQANPDFPLTTKIKIRKKDDDWSVVRFREHHLRLGDIVLLWQSGKKAGIYGLGELTSRVYINKDEVYVVDIRYIKPPLDPPIFKSDLCEDQLLKDLEVIKMPRGKNPFRVLYKEWQYLKKKESLNKLIGFLEK